MIKNKLVTFFEEPKLTLETLDKTQGNIVIITSGQPSLNPRIVKEADALIEAGYEVTVIYQFWNDWGTDHDNQLLPLKKWKTILVGGSSKTKQYDYWKTRLIQKIATSLFTKISLKNGIAEWAIGRCTYKLAKKAMSIPANLYIAHNLAALPAAVLASKKYKAKCGFDSEDFHRNETSDNPMNYDVLLKMYIENKYLPQLDYLSTASPLISKEYSTLFPEISPVTILNTFPKQLRDKEKTNNEKLKLFWFSQTIGIDRGLENVIKIIGTFDAELHLLGNHDENIKSHFLGLANKSGLKKESIHFYKPIPANEIFTFSLQFDIGLATELSTPKNRDICLTNKIFTYIQSGLAILASDTTAQKQLLKDYPNMGVIYEKNNLESLTHALKMYLDNRTLLNKHQKQAYKYAQETLNWEVESKKFLSIVEHTLKC